MKTPNFSAALAQPVQIDKSDPRRRRRIFFVSTLLSVLPVVMYLYYPTFMILLAGMAPTGVAYMFDVNPRKSLPRTVGWMNFAGCLLVMIDLWANSNTFDYAVDLLSDWFNWFLMFVCASVGLSLYLLVPPLVESYISISLNLRLKRLYGLKKELEQEWGDEVTEYSEMDTLKGLEERNEELRAYEERRSKRKKKGISEET